MQRGILEPVPPFGRHLFFSFSSGDAQAALRRVTAAVDGVQTIIGFGASLGVKVEGLHELPSFAGEKVHMPSTPAALWLWLRGDAPAELTTRGDALVRLAAPEFVLLEATDTFKHDGGRDLTGYEDGTENPKGEKATAAAFDAHGGSFVALQHWVHDLKHFSSLPGAEQDDIIGRERVSNDELPDAPVAPRVIAVAVLVPGLDAVDRVGMRFLLGHLQAAPDEVVDVVVERRDLGLIGEDRVLRRDERCLAQARIVTTHDVLAQAVQIVGRSLDVVQRIPFGDQPFVPLAAVDPT